MRDASAPEAALAWHRSGHGAVLVTLLQCWGSAPRRPGAQMAVSGAEMMGAGQMAGSVSGGCVEGAVVAAAPAILQAGQGRFLRFEVSDDNAFAVGLSCGGTLLLWAEPVGPQGLPEPLLAALTAARAARTPVTYRLNPDTGARALAPAAPGARVTQMGQDWLVPFLPPPRLFVIGAVPIAAALAPMARLAGFDVTLIDPRPAFADPERFPGETLLDDWPDLALSRLKPDAQTAIAVLTHDPKLDDPALRAALSSPAFYIGALGARRTQAARAARLADLGTTLGRLKAPIGLQIGAETPGEIAVAILAELIKARNAAPGHAAPPSISY